MSFHDCKSLKNEKIALKCKNTTKYFVQKRYQWVSVVITRFRAVVGIMIVRLRALYCGDYRLRVLVLGSVSLGSGFLESVCIVRVKIGGILFYCCVIVSLGSDSVSLGLLSVRSLLCAIVGHSLLLDLSLTRLGY